MLSPTNAYNIKLPDFEGPLDLLLHLIERQELDITTVSLAAVTGQYLESLTILETLEVDALTDFLVIAAKLILIKSQALLPRPPESEADDEESAGDELVRQLITYKQFKAVAQGLSELEAANRQTFVRVAPPPKIETKVDLSGVTAEHLWRLVREALAVERPTASVGAVVRPFTLTIRDQIALIEHRLAQQQHVSFRRLLERAHSRVEIIVTFLAVLELLKRRAVKLEQAEIFGDIVIAPSEEQPPAGEAVDEPLMDEESGG
ncbi:MAG TPA: segregation/condensation protein A [Anaerolineae bacterium]|nr:segregation/condensation protein A [Anaerolineae bacterium]